MGRRVKESPDVHRKRIASAAEKLFASRGIASTTVEDIAHDAGYGKATIYVYFKNKEDIVGLLILNSMNMLFERISYAVHGSGEAGTRATYNALCNELVRYEKEYPFYFRIILNEINVDLDQPETLEVERAIFEAGELINVEIARFLEAGIARGDLRADLPILQTVFVFWASLSGLIVTASNKADYIKLSMGQDPEEFLDEGFGILYHSIEQGK